MLSQILEIPRGFLIAFFGALAGLFFGLALWKIWRDAITPRLIPNAEIDNAADDIIARYSDPELEAFARHQLAKYRRDGAAQIYWRRARKAVARRLDRG